MKLDRRIEEAVPAGQQLQELGMRLRCDDASSDQVSFIKLYFENGGLIFFINNLLQDDLLDEDRLMLDRSPDELGSHEGDLDDLDSDDDMDEATIASDGERIIYPVIKLNKLLSNLVIKHLRNPILTNKTSLTFF